MIESPFLVGQGLHTAARYEEAIPYLLEAIKGDPSNPAPYTLAGSALASIGKPHDGLGYLTSALAFDPNFVHALVIIGGVLIQLGEFEAAHSFLDRAVQLAPNFCRANWNLAQCELYNQNWKRGFALYEWGKSVPGVRPVHFPYSHWQGEKIPGKTLVLWAEQGLGDVLQFLRFVPAVKNASQANIVIQVNPDLVRLVASSFSDCIAVAQTPILSMNTPWDAQCGLLSVPHVMGLKPLDVGPHWAKAAPSDDYRGKAGLCWEGSATQANNANRSIPIEMVKTLEGVRDWVKIGGSDTDELPFEMARAPRRDFLQLAQWMAGMDGIVTADTSIVHLAGSLGLKTTLIAPKTGEWRWGARSLGHQNPWHPTVKVYRPTMTEGFEPVLEQIKGDMK